MSLDLLDRSPRMRDYMAPADLNLEACVDLAATVLEEQAAALTHAARLAARVPSKENFEKLRMLRDFYKYDWFKVLSCGLADGEQVSQQIIKEALRGMKVNI